MNQHELRLQAINKFLGKNKVETVLDLGCGQGDLILRLEKSDQYKKVVGVDNSPKAIFKGRENLAHLLDSPDRRVQIFRSCITELGDEFCNFEAAVLLEVIEHIAPNRLSVIEKAIFDFLKPKLVLMTAPNKDFNPIHGLEDGKMRHLGHRFEWGREKFRKWAQGVAKRNEYSVFFSGIGRDAWKTGSSSQLAAFRTKS